nr:unnamed protein product [Digitaria exilis]
MPPPVSSLPDELVEEFLLRLPPDTPASLVHAGLVCNALTSGGWELSKVIDLGTLSVPHGQGHFCPYLVGSAEGIGVVLLWAKGVLFTVDLRYMSSVP